MHFTSQHFSFLKANLACLFTGKFRVKTGNTPRPNHAVPENFSCIGIAAAQDPKVDQYLIEQLIALHIKRVRLDFNENDFGQPAERLLKALLETSLSVHLHLVQPFEQAKAMQSTTAQTQWQTFVDTISERYGKQVALIEVGSTVNRKRWAGYDLNRFMIMWQIAHKTIKQHNITLAGPSVTDFEPICNIGFLNLLKERQLLPDIHTNNLFSERCTEPERDDHKIFGRTLAKLANVRLVKKAKLLDQISRDHGVNTWHSPSAFWTLPRIERILPDSAEKQADYLTRYMVLCAASGTMQSAGWGPMVCHREGLISDGVTTYPALERVTHYANISSDVMQHAPRPAFSAFKQFNQTLQGAHYIQQLTSEEGLEIHVFNTDNGLCHVAWTINGKAALLREIYKQPDKISNTIDRDGNTIDLPDLITESPIYLFFDKAPEAFEAPSIVANLSIYRQAKDTQHFYYAHGEWRGLIAAKDRDEYALLAKALDPAALEGPSKTTTLRKARNAIWTIPDPRNPANKLVVKQPVKVPWYKKITDHFKPSKALRSWTGANELLRRGIPNAKPIAYFEHTDDSSRTQNFYLCEFVASDFSVRTVFTAFAKGARWYEDLPKDSVIQQVQAFLFDMHQRGVFFRDLSGGNILISKQDNGRLAFSLIDTGRAHFFNHPTALSKRLSDMARACNKLDAQSRNALMQQYMQQLNRPFGWREKLPFIVYNTKVVIKRKTKLKNLLKHLGLKKKH